MENPVIKLNNWYQIGQTSTALIKPLVYFKFGLNQNLVVWLIARGGYFVGWTIWAYPGMALVISMPLLIRKSTRTIFTKCYHGICSLYNYCKK